MDPIEGVDDGSPARSPMPEAGNDPADPLRPEVDDDDDGLTPPLGAPGQDMDVTEDADQPPDQDDEENDDESELSDLDDQQFEDFDANAITIDERPVALDETNLGELKSHKRKRAEGDEAARQKKRDKRRDRPKKSRRKDDGEGVDGEIIEGGRSRKHRDGDRKDKSKTRIQSPVNEEELSPEERRKRALERAMDDALKNPNRRRKRLDGIDLEQANDDLLENMRRRMTDAAQADAEARARNEPAMRKLKLLPEVVALLNRNTLREQIVDPDINLLEAVRFFLEPLTDGSLPAYNIQRELFMALGKLPIAKDALRASGIGKVTLFYTKSTKPEANIKRQAERLLGEWTRPIIKRSDDYRKKEYVEASYDPNALPVRTSSSSSQAAAAAAARERKLATPMYQNRARVEGGLESYNIVPRSTITQAQFARAPGASHADAFRRLKSKHQAKTGSGGSRR